MNFISCSASGILENALLCSYLAKAGFDTKHVLTSPAKDVSGLIIYTLLFHLKVFTQFHSLLVFLLRESSFKQVMFHAPFLMQSVFFLPCHSFKVINFLWCSMPELSATPFPSTVFRSCWNKAGKEALDHCSINKSYQSPHFDHLSK